MVKTCSRYGFVFGLVLGVVLCLWLRPPCRKQEAGPKRPSVALKYDDWLSERGGVRRGVSFDESRYGAKGGALLEKDFLQEEITVLCMVLVEKDKNHKAAGSTWMKSCNARAAVDLTKFKEDKASRNRLPNNNQKILQNWEIFCKALRRINMNENWLFVATDQTFAILENFRYSVVHLNHMDPHYFGHSVTFWSVAYNVREAGFVLSRGALELWRTSTNSCELDSRFFKNEDFFLGQQLARLGVKPQDTRDDRGLSVYHGLTLLQLFFPGSIKMSSYYKNSLYPVQCCSSRLITFRVLDDHKMYTYHYMLYTLQIFKDGHRGNKPIYHSDPDEVWKSFLKEQGVEDTNISADAYYRLWKSIYLAELGSMNASIGDLVAV